MRIIAFLSLALALSGCDGLVIASNLVSIIPHPDHSNLPAEEPKSATATNHAP